MMGFLPLSSAISGNVGLQASTVTTRAISHDHVTKRLYCTWLAKEIAAGACLGLGMGCVLGTYAFFASGMDYAFALTIFTAQFVSIVTAGLTGTLAPLMFTFIFQRDSALYGGPLETAIQDIVGSFAMVVLSYQLLLFFGPMEISPDDICGSQGAD
jgi:magnesium transporter